MEMTGSVSAGISLLESEPPSAIFRWHYVHGLLAPFNGAVTPRDFSPCGITLDRNAPTLSNHPERVYDWIPSGLSLPEVLLVPLFIGRSEPLGTLWILADHIGAFHGGHARAMQELATFIGLALKMVRAEEDTQRLLEQQEILTREMSHRLKNVFAIVDGMIRISDRSTTSKADLVQMLSGRLHALAAAHSLVRRGFSEVHEAVSDLRALLKVIVEPHDVVSADGRGKFSFDGPGIMCGEQAVNGLALIFHELATNAAKYGVLGRGSGRIDVGWRLRDADLVVTWLEQGDMAIEAAPQHKGFGSTLLESTVTRQFQGSVEHDWRPDGLVVTIALPLSRLET